MQRQQLGTYNQRQNVKREHGPTPLEASPNETCITVKKTIIGNIS